MGSNMGKKHGRKSEKETNDTQKVKDDYLNQLKAQTELSVAALQKHIQSMHPKEKDWKTKQRSNWSMFQDMGSLSNCSCCIQRRIQKVSKSVGLGPSLYLLSLKSYIVLFFFLSLLSIPSIVVLASGDQVKDNGVKGSGIYNFFARGTLGNIGGMGSTSCQHVNLAQNPASMQLKCPSGVFSKITAVGLSQHTEQAVCSVAEQARTQVAMPDGVLVESKVEQAKMVLDGTASVFKNYVPLEPTCSSFLSQGFRESQFVKTLETQFDSKCRGQTQCSITDFSVSTLDEPCLSTVLTRAFSSEFNALALSFDRSKLPPSISQPPPVAFNPQTPEPVLNLITWCTTPTLKLKGSALEMTK